MDIKLIIVASILGLILGSINYHFKSYRYFISKDHKGRISLKGDRLGKMVTKLEDNGWKETNWIEFYKNKIFKK